MIEHYIYLSFWVILGVFFSLTNPLVATAANKGMLAHNGAFESDQGWVLKKHDGAEGYIEFSSEARTGERSIKIVKTNGRGFLQLVSEQPTTINPETIYVFRCFYSCQNSKLDSLLLLRVTNTSNDQAFAYNSGVDQSRGMQSQSLLVNSNRGEWAKRIVSHKCSQRQEVYMNVLLVGNPVSVLLDDIEITLPDYQRVTEKFKDRGPYPYSEEQVLSILDKRQNNEAYMQAKGNRSELIYNNEPIIPIMYKAETYCGDMQGNRYTEFGEAGVPFALRSIPLSRLKSDNGVVLAPGEYDFSCIDKLIMHVLRQNPYASIVVQYDIQEPYPDWGETHLDEVWQDEEGKLGYGFWGNIEGFVNNLEEVKNDPKHRRQIRQNWNPWLYPSYSSESYCATHKKSIYDITKYLMSSCFGKAIVGFNIHGGHDTQFQYRGSDFSKAGTSAFRKFLQNRYGTIGELNKKLETTYNDFSEVQVPQQVRHEELSHPLSVSINTEYNDFTSQESWKLKHVFAQAARDAAGKKVFITSYGRPPEFFPDALCKGVNGVDISADQGAYPFRRPGFPVGWRTASTYGLHGKMGLWELDLRTWTYPQRTELYEEWVGIAYTPEMWQSVHRKWAGMALANNGALWYYSMNRYFDHPEIMAEIKAVTTAANRILTAPEIMFRPDVCIIRSEDAQFHVTASQSTVRETPNMPMQMLQLETSGVAYDLYQLNDVLTRSDLQNYKVYIFMHTAKLTSFERSAIAEKLEKPGRTLVFLYNSGYIDESGKNTAAMKMLTGFDIATKDEYSRAVPLLNAAHPLGEGINPMISGGELCCNIMSLRGGNRHFARYQVFKIKSAQPSEVLARYSDGGIAAAVRRTSGDCRIIYSAAPYSLSAGLFYRIAKTAGAYTVGLPGQSIHMNGKLLSFHGVTPGNYTINLPCGVDKVINPFTGKTLVENVKAFTFNVKVGVSTWLLFTKTATGYPWLQPPLLEYNFNKTGTVVTNSGSAIGNNLILKDIAKTEADLHSPPGSGVTAGVFDYAFDNRAGLTNGALGGIAVSTVAPSETLTGLRSLTLTGWIKNLSKIAYQTPRIIHYTTGSKNGFELVLGGNTMQLFINNASVSSTSNVRQDFTKETEWTFFAVSWDGSLESSNVTFYQGSPTQLKPPIIATLPQTVVTNTPAQFCVGNSSDQQRALPGMIDDLRVFGSHSDGSGALTTFQVDYLRRQTVPTTNETIYLSAGSFASDHALPNLLDNQETTFVANFGNDGVLVWDRRSVTPIHDFGLTSRNSTPSPGLGPPQSWCIEVQENDDPSATTGWFVLAAVTNIYGVTDALCNNLGRRVTFEPVTNRYIRWKNTYTGDRSDIASFNIGRQVYVYASSNTVSGSYPINYATDGNADTFANIVSWGDNKTTGLLVLDVLRTNKHDHVTQLRLQHRSDASSDIWPKDYIVSVSSTDDPANFDTVIATGQLEQPATYAPYDKGRWWSIDFERQSRRFFQFEWSSAWGNGAQVAEIAVTSINWMRRGSLTILQ